MKIGDSVKVLNVFPTLRTVGSSSGVEATVFSNAFSLGLARNFAVIGSVEHISTVGPRKACMLEVLGGTTTYASPTAFTSIGGCTVMASGATQTKVNYARVCIRGTCSKVSATMVIDGVTFSVIPAGGGGVDSSIVVKSTIASVVVPKLATCIEAMCTNLDAAYYTAGVTSGPGYVDIRGKDGNYVFDIKSSVIQTEANTDGCGILCSRSAMYEFSAAEVIAKSTLPYTQVAFRMGTTGTVARMSAQLICGDERYNPRINIARDQMNTVSTAYST